MEQSYPQQLLQTSSSEKVAFFVNYTMAHPHLIQAFNEVMQSVYHAPGISLIFVVGATGVGKTTLLHRLEQKLTEKALPELKHNQGKIPVIGLEAKAFKSVVQTFSQYLPLLTRPDLSSHWEFLYERSLGCVGILKDWLSQTLCAVLDSDEKAQTITLFDLERYAPSVRQCLVMLKAISLGEQQLQESDEDLLKLQQALKLTPLSDRKQTHSQTQAKKTKKPIAQASPRRYPLNKEEEATDSFHSS